jgi:hypothetical protein
MRAEGFATGAVVVLQSSTTDSSRDKISTRQYDRKGARSLLSELQVRRGRGQSEQDQADKERMILTLSVVSPRRPFLRVVVLKRSLQSQPIASVPPT